MCRKLIQIQRSALLIITRAFRTVSSSALQVLAGCPPLDLVVERIATWQRLCMSSARQDFDAVVLDPFSVEGVRDKRVFIQQREDV